MKLRIRGNSIRLRVTQSEVAKLVAGLAVEETTTIGDRHFGYALVPAPSAAADSAGISASFDGGNLTVCIPAAQASSWGASAEVGIEAQLGELALLIEKDFACLDPRDGAEDSDTFPNPKAL